MKLKTIYLIIAVFGTVIPMSYFISYVNENGFHLFEIFNAIYENDLTACFTWDVVISLFALVGFILSEGLRLGMKRKWIYILMGLFVGVSMALPAFLYAREVRLETMRNTS